MTTKHDIIWINNKHWASPWQYLLGSGWLIDSPFWKTYVWYILFTIIWSVLFYISKFINKFNKIQTNVIYYGYGIGLFILYGMDFFYNTTSTRYVDKDTKNIFTTRVSQLYEEDYILLEDKNNILQLDNFKSNDSYAFEADYINKLIKENKIKAIPTTERSKSITHKDEEQFFKDINEYWDVLRNHRNITLITLLSLAYVIAYWNFHKLRKIFPWISVIFALLLSLQGVWFVWSNNSNYVVALYVFRKVQEIITALSIISILIYINL
jgi:hypothetical protein